MHYLSILWNPSEGIDLGFFTIRFYSLMFVVAFVLGFVIMKKIYQAEGIAVEKVDSLFIYFVVATLIGARLGHVIFYQPELFAEDPLSVFLPIRTVPNFEFTGFQGLASHGATIAIIIAMFMYSKKVLQKPVLWILDRTVIAAANGAIFVRIGNFINSEIIGKPSGNSPLGVRFLRDGISKYEAVKITGIKDVNKAYNAIAHHPEFADVLNSVPFRHPAQLYESVGYIFVFLILWYFYWKTNKRNKLGFLFGMFLILLFTVRFIVEFLKESQGGFETDLGNALSTGQWLSIPFVLIGLYFVFRPEKEVVSSQ